MNILNRIQVLLNAPKNQFNNFGKYSYRSLEDIFEGLKPLLKEYKCSVVVSDDLMLIGDRYYIKAVASLLDENNSIIASSSGFARETLNKKGMDESQITGSSSSYARKYALNGLFAIDDVRDSDSMDNVVSKITSEQLQHIMDLINETGTDIIKFCKAYKVEKIAMLTKQQADDGIKKLTIKGAR